MDMEAKKSIDMESKEYMDMEAKKFMNLGSKEFVDMEPINEKDREWELLCEQLKYTKKQVHYLRISSILSLVLVAAILIIFFTFMQKLDTTLANVDEAVKQVESLKLNELDVQKIASDVDRLVIDTEESMQEAMNRLNSIDFESLNEAIQGLNTVVSPLAALFGGH